MSPRCARLPATLLLLVTSALAGACALDPGGVSKDGGGDDDGPDAAGRIDADPSAPDADPSAPDAAPTPDGPPPAECGDGSGAATVPFASHTYPYVAGTALPDRPQAQLDNAVRAFYDTWKDRYVDDGCAAGRYLVKTGHADNYTVSEAHGYGMLASVFMAGHDPEAKQIFDGMYAYYLAHPSASTPFLMAWAQNASCNNVSGPTSATDGDLDIANALLLADTQWGSGGAIDYRAAAAKIIDAIQYGDVDSTGRWLLLGDWVGPGEDHYNATRTSDFMPGHLDSFAAFTGDAFWTGLLGSEYTIVSKLQQGFAASTGLLPDFVVKPMTPAPAPNGFLEGSSDGRYGYNACRDPWRLGIHFLTKGDARAKTAVTKLNGWVQDETGGDPGNILPIYTLGGEHVGGNYSDMCFVAPFGVSAMVSPANQDWLNAVWDEVASAGPQGYYQDSVKLLSMIAMSGNWWTPESVDCD